MDDDDFDNWVDREKREEKFLAYCKQHDLDPDDEESREDWEENEKQRATHDWDQMDPEDEEGWTDNMNKD